MEKLKQTQVLTITAMLIAIATVLGFFKVPLNPLVELRFAFLPIASAGMLFGPGVGAIVGALADVLGYLAKPTGPFFPGFTISGAVSVLLYGLCLYKKPLTVPRVIFAQFVQVVVISLILNNINLSILYGNGFFAVMVPRLLKTAIMFPINTVLLFVMLKAMQQIAKQFLPQEQA